MTSRWRFVSGVVLISGCFAAQPVDTDDTDEGTGSSSSAPGTTSTSDTSSTGQPTESTTTPPQTTASSSSTNPTGSGTSSTSDLPTTDDSSSTGSLESSSSTGGAASCDGDASCVPTTPMGWTGPVAIAEASAGEMPDCAGAFEELQPTVHDSPTEDPAECTCGCTIDMPPECGPAIGASYQQYSTSSTCGGLSSQELAGTLCSATSLSPGESVNPPYESITSLGGCSGDPSQFVPEPEWSTDVRVCGGATRPLDCSEGTACAEALPDGFDATCIWMDGDVDCPGGQDFYLNKRIYYTDFDDTRSCSGTCGCNGHSYDCGGGAIEFYANADCTGLLDSVSVGECGSASGTSTAARFFPSNEAENVVCGGAGTYSAEGQVDPAGPVTFCCG